MKVNKFLSYIATGLFMAGAMTSCIGDLNSDVIDPDVKPLDPQKMYVKCYASLIMEGNDGSADFDIDDAGKSTLLRNIYNLECLSTDEAICWWTDGGLVNASYNQSGAEDQVLRFMYYRLMSNITYCNHYLETEACLALGKDKAAEVRWIRAYNYYVLANTFGNVPFLTKISSDAEPLATREEMYHWLVSEFRAVEEDLLEARPKSSSDPNYGRLDKAAAWLMLSRMYLNAEVWKGDFNDANGGNLLDSVKVLSDKIITEGKYELFTGESDVNVEGVDCHYTAYDMLFMADNGESGAAAEAILPLLQDGAVTRGWGGSLFFTAAHWSTAMKTVCGLSAGTTGVDWTGMRVRRQLVEKFTDNPQAWEGKTAKEIRAVAGDDRALFWGVDHSVSIGDNTMFEQGLATVKWNNRRSDGKPTNSTYEVDGDFFLLRAAEAYLNYVEADIRINGACSEKAKGYMDDIRTRAHATAHLTYSLEDVLDERSREFYCEGYRRTDLIRFGQYGGNQATYVWDGKNGTTPGTAFEAYRNIYPIPTSELMTNDNLWQNDGY